MASSRRALLCRIAVFASFFAAIFLLASLVTHHPDDPPAGTSSQVRNACGEKGAWVSHYMLAAAGTGSYLGLGLVMALAVAYVVRGAVGRRYFVSAAAAALVLFLLLSLVSFDATADPHRASGGDPVAGNTCGYAGATTAYYLMDYVGFGIWVALAAAGVALAAYVARRAVADKVLRTVGVVLLVCFISATATIADRHDILRPDPADVLPVGLGGVLGQFLADTFLTHIGAVGAYLVLVLMAVVGLLLATDGLALLFPVAIWKWLRKRKVARIEALSAASDRLRRGFAAARDAMAAGSATAAAAAAGARSKGVRGEKASSSDDDRQRQDRIGRAIAKREAADSGAAKSDAAEKDEKREAPKIRMPRERKAEPLQDQAPAPSGGRTQATLIDNAEGLGEEFAAYKFPSLDLLDPPDEFDISDEEVHIRQNAANLEGTLKQFGVDAEVVGIDTGPVITQYEVSLGAGIKVGKVISLSDDLAIGLKAPSVRIIAPLPGRGTIGIEVPNRNTKLVRIREAVEDGLPLAKRHNLPLFLGKDTAGNALVRDLTAMPHLLIGGTTGSGKSVCLNSVITSILFTRSPRDVKFILVDPKMVEMTMFSRMPHLMCPVVSDMSRVYSILEWLMDKMQERYSQLATAGVKNIIGYNALSRDEIIERFQPTGEDDKAKLTYHMPYIILIVDELADLMMSAPKEVEAAITRLAQKSRAVGIHLVLATQRPSVDVVTGLIKSNHPCRIAFQVASRVDSRTIIDCMGAEKLLGRGDMLLMQPGASKLLRAQGAYISEEEITRVVDAVSDGAPRVYNRELVQLKPKSPKPARGRSADNANDQGSFQERDDLYNDAVRIVLQHQRGSVSLLQRKLTIGYGRASRLIDFMAEDGIVGEYQGSQAREVLMTLDDWESQRGEGVGALAAVVGDDEDGDSADAGPDDGE